MKVLVTGGAGYIGSHCVKALINAGHQVIVFDSTTSDHANHLGAHLFKGDIRNRQDLDKVCSATEFNAVMHFAAKIEVKESESDPGKYYENNVLGTINILETMRKFKINNIVFSSTAAVYGNNPNIPLKEDEVLEPTSVYGKTKLIIERILQDYNKAYGMNAVIFRYFNAAGAHTDGSIGENHQPESHLIPILIEKMNKKEAITVNGNDYPTKDGTAVRDYVHVMDIAQAHVLGLEYAEFEKGCQIFNIGSGSGYSINEVIKTMEEITGDKIKIEYGPRRPGDPAVLTAATDKIQKTLGWKPEYSSIQTILQTAIHWHKNIKKTYSN